jgi:glycosyltransferase involved in cell wall biosynthesis
MLCLDRTFSTTRQVTKEKPVIEAQSEDKFESVLFLPEGEGRQGEGGLRTQGFFKTSLKDKPLITVITVVFNGEQYLEETILSVINQAYDNVEYIIIDGGSTDSTLEIIRKYEHAIDYWVSEKDKGIYDAWNKAVKLSCGEWISFLGADDSYTEDALKLYAQYILRMKNMNYISSRVNLKKNNDIVRVIGSKFNAETIKKRMNIAHVGSLHNRNLFENNGLFSLDYNVASDYEFFVRTSQSINAGFLSEVTAIMRVGGASDGSAEVFYEVANIKVKYGLRSKPGALLEAFYSKLKWEIRHKFWY